MIVFLSVLLSASGDCTVTLYAYETMPTRPRKSHTFAVFNSPSDEFAISWLPHSKHIKILGVERGSNFTLAQTLIIARQNGARVYKFGPYKIKFALYELALKQKQKLESGTVKYEFVGGNRRDQMNCIQAVLMIIPEDQFHTGTSWGRQATLLIRDHWQQQGWIIANETP